MEVFTALELELANVAPLSASPATVRHRGLWVSLWRVCHGPEGIGSISGRVRFWIISRA